MGSGSFETLGGKGQYNKDIIQKKNPVMTWDANNYAIMYYRVINHTSNARYLRKKSCSVKLVEVTYPRI